MNILFLIFHGLSEVSGISKKIMSQVDGLRKNGHQVSLCHYEIREDNHRVRMVDNIILSDYGCGRLAPIRKRTHYKAIVNYAAQQNIEIVYVRSFHNANPFTINLFKQLKKLGIKIAMEIPTYPYDQEYCLLPFQWKIELFIDKCFRKKLAQHCDTIVTFSGESRIFGQTTTCISNGVDFNRLRLKSSLPTSANEIHFIAVAEIHYWHGYDRIIEGLGIYYQNAPVDRIYLHIVGGIGTEEEKTFRQLIEHYQIESYVIFHGQQQGKQLDELFDLCHFAIGSLGRHRSGIEKIKTLKNREYAARGIPFIYSEIDDDFEQMPYILKIPADDTPVDVLSILDFRNSLHISSQDIRNSITDLSWKKQMQKVIDKL